MIVLALAPSIPLRADDFSGRLNALLKQIAVERIFPQRLPGDVSPWLLEEDGYEDFPKVSGAPPIATKVLLNGRNDGVNASDAELAEVFEDDQGILLPPNGQIRRINPGTEAESWDYPAWTRLAHRIFLKTTPRTLYEVRLLEKEPDGSWDFGVYVPQETGRLGRASESAVFKRKLTIAGRRVRVETSRLIIPSSECGHCHAAISPNRYPEGTTGPCGFGPGNPALRGGPASAWAKAFKEKHGYNPFWN